MGGRSLRDRFLLVLAWFGLAVMLAAAVWWFVQPIYLVKRVWPEAECREVVPAGDYDCDNLPPRYAVEWVSPEYQKTE